jgi:DNA repair photolyase
MRWDSLRVEDDEAAEPAAGSGTGGAQQALFARETVVTRTFDTPGFRGITFHEVHARSIVSKVPQASRMPFRWTINPYRGCAHACVYCLAGETPVLMADGRTKPIAELQVGDAVYGTVRQGSYRRYTPTTVLAHWQTVKPGYRITLEDGTSLVASADHRFLTGRGWKYVTGTEHGSARRPHLTTSSKLLGVGAFAEPPKESADYRRGYLCGMIRGDAGADPGSGDVGFSEALQRASRYRAEMGTGTAAVTCAEWPSAPSADWRKGFLAGIFDAEGSCSRGILRISSTDSSIIDWATSSMSLLGFDVAVELVARGKAITVLRLRGGLTERLRFFHTVDPAITRKRVIDGLAIKSDARLKVVSVEPLGLDLPMYDITTGTGDFIADGVVSHNCFARNTHTYLEFDSGHDFDSQVVVKVNAPELLRKELRAARWAGEHIAMGTNVDCYQRAEGRYQLMPGIITALTEARNPFSILTKGTLLLRDIDLLARAAEVTDVGLNVSVGIIDKSLSRSVEPGTPSPDRRLAVCAALAERGLQCGVLMGPVLPYLSDSPDQLAAAVRAIASAGATHVTPIVLHLRPGAREWFQRWLVQTHPELVDAYRELYGARAYAPKTYQRQISEQVAELAREYGVGRTTPAGARRVSGPLRGSGPGQRAGGPGSGSQGPLVGPEEISAAVAAEPQQLSLL